MVSCSSYVIFTIPVEAAFSGTKLALPAVVLGGTELGSAMTIKLVMMMAMYATILIGPRLSALINPARTKPA
jgi:hypothetical protein